MIRQFRRALRQWKAELGSFWGRFNTFYRIVFGILLAMAIVYAARRQLLDERRAAVASLRKELTDHGAPDVVPSLEEDNEVQEMQLQAESLAASLEREREATRRLREAARDERAAAEDGPEALALGNEDRPRPTRAQAIETIETLGRLVGKHGLSVRNAARVECQDDFPVPRICQSYHLVGDFVGIHAFLRDVNGLDAPCRLRGVAVFLSDADLDQTKSPARQTLALTFHFESLYAE
jgi:hypothetical protein